MWTLALLAGPARVAASAQHVEGHVQIGLLDDSNVRESLEDETSDQALQVFGSLRHRAALAQRLRLASVWRLGMHRYRNIKDDSRVMGEAGFDLSYTARNRTAAGVRLQLETRDYADSAATRGFGSLVIESFLRVPIGSVMSEVKAARTLLDYRVTTGREQAGFRGDGALSKQLSRRFLARLQGGAGTLDFNRRAVRVTNGQVSVLPSEQEDSFWHIGAELQYLRGFYLEFGYRYLQNDSNTFGWDFASHRFDATFGDRLTRTTSIRLLARLDLRDYEGDLDAFGVVNFDSEREDNDAIVAEVGHTIQPDLLLKLRLGWHHNESVFRDRRYTKLVTETHLEWRF